MPYVTMAWRVRALNNGMPQLIDFLKKNTKEGKENNGLVVYVIYKMIQVIYGKGNFEVKSNALKVLSAAELEYYRRIMAPYEDEKIAQNGDV